MRRAPQDAIFLAAALVATSAGITAQVLSDLGALGTRAAKIILATTPLDTAAAPLAEARELR